MDMPQICIFLNMKRMSIRGMSILLSSIALAILVIANFIEGTINYYCVELVYVRMRGEGPSPLPPGCHTIFHLQPWLFPVGGGLTIFLLLAHLVLLFLVIKKDVILWTIQLLVLSPICFMYVAFIDSQFIVGNFILLALNIPVSLLLGLVNLMFGIIQLPSTRGEVQDTFPNVR